MTDIEGVYGPRTRSRSEGPDQHKLIKTHNGSPFASYTSTAHSQNEVISDIVTENYEAKIRSGAIINNPCKYVKTLHSESSGSYIANRVSVSEDFTTSGGSVTAYHRSLHSGVGYLVSPLISSEQTYQLEREAKFHALSQIDTTPYAFGEDLGEVAETLKFLRSPFSSLLKLGRTFERDVYRASKKKARKRKLTRREEASRLFNNTVYRGEVLASAWSEYRFAAAPLLRSAMDVVEAVSWHEGITLPQRFTARGFAEDANTASDQLQANFNSTTFDVFKRSTSHEVKVSAGILYEVSNPLQNVQWRLGLRVRDIPPTLWELLPLSFMVDRVIDIRRTLVGLINLSVPSVRVRAGWVTTRSDSIKTLSLVAETVPDYVVTVNPDVQSETEFTYWRETWRPSAFDAVPQIKLRRLVDDITKTVDLVALTLNSLRIRLY